eukprot:CAMPEP_0196656418 /NCGR_PEP_ID=MMETSP1086-20130531/17015_1 /TAXON_ID=77921 /ORGANISM="Cyanoptyche  gloeocystis , Strain SAG4.97" /LENGTH=34 /DNA_ID= /DNA_START= /DNA_END= /DNA_ORIENTATION=
MSSAPRIVVVNAMVNVRNPATRCTIEAIETDRGV